MVKEEMAHNYIQRIWNRWRESTTAINISKVYFGDVVSRILGVGTAFILIRGMTKSDYALYVAFTSIAILSASLVGNGINSALVRFSAEQLSRTGEKPYTLYLLSLIAELAVFLILLLCVIIFPTQIATLVFGNSKFANLLIISMLFGLGNLLLVIGQRILQAEEKFNFYVGTLWLRQGLAFLIVGVLWLSRAMGFRYVAWGLAILQFIVGVGISSYVIMGIAKVSWQRIIEREKQLVRQFLSASGWLIAYCSILAAFSRMDVVMLSRFASEEALADYGVAFKYYSLALLLLVSINAVLRPKFSHIEMQNKTRQRQFLTKWLQYSVWIGVPVMLFIIFGKPLFIFVNGVQYEQSFPILAILSIGAWLSLMLSPLTNILMSRKKFRFLFLLGLSAFLVNLIASYMGVRMWGGVGAAIAVVLTHNVVLQVPILWRVLK